MRMTNVPWLIFLMLFTMACVDEISIDLPEAQAQYKVVEGYVESDRKNYVFWGQVSLTQDVTGTFQPLPLGGQIYIRYNGTTDIPIEGGRVTKIELESFHNQYGGDPQTARFQLVAELNGQEYISHEERIIPVPRPDSISVVTEVRQELNATGNLVQSEYIKFRIHTPLINERNEMVAMNWTVSSVYQQIEGERTNPFYMEKTCYVNFNAFQNVINIAGPQDYPGQNRIDALEITETLNDFHFATGCYLTVIQKSLSEGAIEYWKDVKASNERSGNIYDVFPGRIRSNIMNSTDGEEIVHGFFQASQVDTIRLKVTPEMANYPTPRCAFWIEPIIITPDDPDPCLDCLNLGGSTLQPPHYWR